MDDKPTDQRRARPDLAAAIRQARVEEAARTESITNLRTVALVRLGVLRDALVPVLGQVPDEVDLFDVAVMPGEPPRLFIDMIGFVEMAHDRRGYRLYQDRRHGRVLLAESDTVEQAVDAVTAYIARRLVERDKALASDSVTPAASASASPAAADTGPIPLRSLPVRWLDRSRADPLYALGQVFWFVVEVLGLLASFGLLLLGLRGLFAR